MSIFTLALALALSAPAQDTMDEDARCAFTLRAISSPMPAGEGRAALRGAAAFFIGRLTVRMAPEEIRTAIDRAGKTIKPSEYRAFALKCIDQMEALAGEV